MIHRDNLGWDKGNGFLKDVAIYLKDMFPNDLLFRFHGDHFIILSVQAINDDMTLINQCEIFNNSGVYVQWGVTLIQINLSS